MNGRHRARRRYAITPECIFWLACLAVITALFGTLATAAPAGIVWPALAAMGGFLIGVTAE